MVRMVELLGWRFVSGLFRGLARQRDVEASRIVQYYRQDRWSDSLEKDIERAKSRSGHSIYRARPEILS
jgi:hypothetical protein